MGNAWVTKSDECSVMEWIMPGLPRMARLCCRSTHRDYEGAWFDYWSGH